MAKTVHFVFTMSAAGSICQALRQIGCDERVVGFMDDLSFGPIDSDESVREPWVLERLGQDFEVVFRNSERFWAEATASEVRPVVWVCRNHALEYCGYLEFVTRLAEAPFQVVDASDLALPTRSTPSSKLRSLGAISPTQIIEVGLFESQKGVSAPEKTTYLDLWHRLRAENAPFRIVGATGLVSAPITHFDDTILACVTPDWRIGARIVGDAMTALIDRPYAQCLDDRIIWSRVLALGDAGIVDIRGSRATMRTTEVSRVP